MIEPPCTERYARWCERSVGEIIAYLLLDFIGRHMEEARGDSEGLGAAFLDRLPGVFGKKAGGL